MSLKPLTPITLTLKGQSAFGTLLEPDNTRTPDVALYPSNSGVSALAARAVTVLTVAGESVQGGLLEPDLALKPDVALVPSNRGVS